MSYHWDYLKQTEPRGTILAKILKRSVEFPKGCNILDLNCGFAPLYRHFKNHKYIGTDINPICIDYLKQEFPEGTWLLKDDKDIAFHMVDLHLLMLLGIGSDNLEEDGASMTEHISIRHIMESTDPEYVVIERANTVKPDHWEDIEKWLNECMFTVIDHGTYDAGTELNNTRIYSIYQKSENV